MVDDVLDDLRFALVDPDALVRHDRVRAHALSIEARKESAVVGRVGVHLLDVGDGHLAVRVHRLEVALVKEGLDVVLDVVDVTVNDAVALELFNLVDVTALVCRAVRAKGQLAASLSRAPETGKRTH